MNEGWYERQPERERDRESGEREQERAREREKREGARESQITSYKSLLKRRWEETKRERDLVRHGEGVREK